MNFIQPISLEICIPVNVFVTHYKSKVPGNLTGPPELCYPDENTELDFDVVTLSGTLLTKEDLGEELSQGLSQDIQSIIEYEIEEKKAENRILALDFIS